jgi:hypothetical protein
LDFASFYAQRNLSSDCLKRILLLTIKISIMDTVPPATAFHANAMQKRKCQLSLLLYLHPYRLLRRFQHPAQCQRYAMSVRQCAGQNAAFPFVPSALLQLLRQLLPQLLHFRVVGVVRVIPIKVRVNFSNTEIGS